MTGREITERAARITFPELSDCGIKRVAAAIWLASPSGELWHVFALGEMIASASGDIPDFVCSLRNVQATANEFIP